MNDDLDEFFASMRKSDRTMGIFVLIIVGLLFIGSVALAISAVLGELLILVPICVSLAVLTIFVFAVWGIVHFLILGNV